MEWLRSYRPDLVEHYEALYARGAYLPQHERDRLGRLLRDAGAPAQRPFRRDPAEDPPFARTFRRQMGPRRPPEEEAARRSRPGPPDAVQEALF
jgi:hypothetical protein